MVEEVVKLPMNRFGVINQTERFRAELRQRHRQPYESLQELYRSVCRLMALAYPRPSSDLSNIVARDAFLDALGDHSLRIRILEKEPENLDEALKLACKLEAHDNSLVWMDVLIPVKLVEPKRPCSRSRVGRNLGMSLNVTRIVSS